MNQTKSDGRTATKRTPAPTNASHAKALMYRNFQNDMRKPWLWFARTLAIALLIMLYTVGFFIGYENDNAVVAVGSYRLHPGSDWTYPKKLKLAGTPSGTYSGIFPANTVDTTVVSSTGTQNTTASQQWSFFVMHIGNILTNEFSIETSSFSPEDNDNSLSGVTALDQASFRDECTSKIAPSAGAEVCIYLDSTTSFFLYYRGNEQSTPYQPALAGAQYAVNTALLHAKTGNRTTAATSTAPFPVSKNQRIPQLLNEDEIEAPVGVLVTPGLMHVLAAAIMTMFIIAPMTTERLSGTLRAFLLVGVKLRTYMFQWIIYYSLNGILSAIALTMVTEWYRIFPLSNACLVFVSHYLGLIQIYALFTFLSQCIQQEELAQGMPWLIAFSSMGIGIALLMVTSDDSTILNLASVFSPFVGIIQYYGIYITYDNTGVGTGIHPGKNVISSGLLGNMIAQVLGIGFWILVIVLYSSPAFAQWLDRQFSRGRELEETPSTTTGMNTNVENVDLEGNHNGTEKNNDDGDEKQFEALPPNSEVLLSVRGLAHTYNTGCWTSMCNQKTKPIKVLKGLDLDVCRGEVFGYLGHNGAGKTTSVNILAAELILQHGTVQYHDLANDDSVSDRKTTRTMSLAKPEDAAIIRSNIGVCPQHNTGLLDNLTCRETLRLFASLKGNIPVGEDQTEEEAIDAEITSRLRDIGFTSEEDADKPVGTYSGGMKRKVLIALALLGDPRVVFLDEPTAGLDPYNRRKIWDMIIAAKKNRSIILTTHFLDEADVLSDRIGIIKNGKLITCGSSLFLKHNFGVGYTLAFDSDESFDVTSVIDNAEPIVNENTNEKKENDDETNISMRYQWRLKHGTEASFPTALNALSDAGATNVSLELTTLEQVFLETGKEDYGNNDEEEKTYIHGGDDDASLGPGDTRDGGFDFELNADLLAKIWEPRGTVTPLGFWKKFLVVQHFMMTNAWKIKGTIFLNVAQPLLYVVGALLVASSVETPEKGVLIQPSPIPISPYLSGNSPASFFGVPDLVESNPYSVYQPVETPGMLDDYFETDSLPFVGGYFSENATLQYNPDFSPFALQLSTMVLSGYNTLLGISNDITTNDNNVFQTTVQQLPYLSEVPFRVDLLIIPLFMGFGFSGMAFSVLDVLLLKADNIFELFRVAGITEWTTYLGVMMYKCTTTFTPFFLLVVVLGLVLKTVLLGNGGRWLGTILVFLGYAYSTTPTGLILAKRFIHSDFKAASNIFPGIYMTFVGLPYAAWVSTLQALPDSRDTILIIGDVLCIIPQVAFQRGLGAVIEVSTLFNDEKLDWATTWSFQSRVWFTIFMMFFIGSLEWIYLYYLTHTRDKKIVLSDEEKLEALAPVDATTDDRDILQECERSVADDDGINARSLVKVFRVKPTKGSASVSMEPILKRSVKGVSFGIRKNEIFALLGPNGAGKTVTMSMLAGKYTPDHGKIALEQKVVTGEHTDVGHLFQNCDVAYCPQFDALFPSKTVVEHLQFYAKVRGLNWEEESTQNHVGAIIKLLGLEKHCDKESTELSGGYKRRLSLGLAMIGFPKCMMVDECTTGMDPAARHLVWNILKPEIQHEAYDLPAVLLSSHYMDECEKLGSRIGIMIDGEIVTTGSLTRLQERYCTSYFVEISFHTDAVLVSDGNMEDLILKTFKRYKMFADVYESLPHRLKLRVPFVEGATRDDTKQLADIFSLLESNKEALGIEFYAVAQMNLEQIFIDLSRRQFEADDAFRTRRSIYEGNSSRAL